MFDLVAGGGGGLRAGEGVDLLVLGVFAEVRDYGAARYASGACNDCCSHAGDGTVPGFGQTLEACLRLLWLS